ncbi:MAG TPA: 23S rRNA pseudouridine(1911/1915/1917) synthase RluD [Rhodocyclaceae bacterium]|uniref:23S rRNA pseudouridine(1911/1915/1917) synthase RluD n=1 Tax=Zoogloea sp. TaxID=49181 RepID=UPI002CE9186C|nr:23S rRNA pseudouridine(1911/1915/1917) synthase RluD [Zoogloea sp.]HMV63377.1 23S rRNA pseudouridine(1911/1915/1917) synthase RluD [Rhodocyclaceae bacterium]HMZ76378.1 23S rRNA pseudouridine(1911/1915/1917) synthase RluD [Rhodocyclaceae bacterium]HNC79123.1 23S rRNA pseudouridine(1911/1915/1917) synthase RluD [Rhodocyclaceae bacterium]HNF62785.1 23S rRNA pseudouridine(1911/1915/1917) synthase RluD [Rhodocyclaceae bacterium]HNH17191.1 23S rRNA pseudouridine(1911/1915/1917) synthase RluD [Zoo
MKCAIDIPQEDDWLDYSPADPAPSPQRETVPADCAGLRADQALARLFPEHSRSRLQAWLKSGRIRIDGASPDAKCKVWGGETVEVSAEPTEESLAQQAEDIPLAVVFEDDTLAVIDKPVGLVVHPGSGNWSGTLLNGLLHHDPAFRALPRAGIVHRLDKDTSGLLVVAKTLEAQTDLVRQLQARSVKRHYYALVHGQPAEQGTVEAPIGRHPVQRTKMAVVRGGREALTRYRVCERFRHATLVECELATGRTHQIRVHMAHIGHPLVGDATYGKARSADPRLDAFPRQALHAWQLGLIHPRSGEACVWQRALPADFETLLATLRSV